MSSFVVKFITNRLLKDNQWNKLGVEDPYYEYIPLRVDEKGNPTKTKKVARRIPDGLSINDTKILSKVKKAAYRYDMWFNVFGVRVGWTNVVGLIPIVGSIIATYWSLSIYLIARKIDDGLPLDLQLLFFINILIDFALLLIPIVGDLVEIGYKANLRNFLLLDKHLAKVGQKNQGLISEDEVRPGFINDRVQPVVDEKIKPGAIKAGESIKVFVNKHLHSPSSSRSSSSSGTNNASSVFASKSPTIQTSPTTAVSSTIPNNESANSRKSSKVDSDEFNYDDERTVVENNINSKDDSKSVRSLNSLLN